MPATKPASNSNNLESEALGSVLHHGQEENLDLEFNRLYSGDCLRLFPRIATGSTELVFANPPSNIGYDYDIYDDRREAETYLEWIKA
jgi:hypothetical protein